MLKTVSSITNAIGALNFKGTWDANANSPALASSVGTKGDYYVVSTAGATNLNGISNWGVGDWATFNGSVWQRVEGGADLNGVNLSFTGVASGPTYETSNLASGLTISGNSIVADGTDSNINISITPKGTGVVNTTTLVASGTASATKFIPTGNVVDGTGVYSPASGVLGFSTGGGERGRFTGQGFFKAADSASYIDSTGIFHEFSNSDSNGNYVAQFRNNGVANAFGVRIGYTTSPNSTGSAFLACDDSSANRATIRSNGGLANFQSNNVDLSDARTKKEVTLAASMWGKIGALEIVTYKYNDQTHDDVNLGVIAQQVEAVEPVWVGTEGWGDELPEDGIPLKTVYTKDITFAAIKALQEAMARIEKLEAEVSALKGV